MKHNDHERHHSDASDHRDGVSCCPPKRSRDWLLIASSVVIIAACIAFFFVPERLNAIPYATAFSESVVELLRKMWWGVGLGILFVGILAGVPKDLVASVMGRGGSFGGILRATAGGVLLDLCSHGILLVGTQLYRRGASLGQMMAFLIASPWNSLSLTLILWSLVGLPWTLTVLGLSLVIAIVSGIIFDQLVARGVLPPNPHAGASATHRGFLAEVRAYLRSIRWKPSSFTTMVRTGISESRMILRWIFFGVVLASLIRAAVPVDLFAQVFGPTLLGLGATLLFATILEVCSEGSMPVAVDFLLRAGAPGNMFAFLMTGVSTDYTEIMALKETTGRWKTALFLPLVTVPQVVLLALLLNQFPT